MIMAAKKVLIIDFDPEFLKSTSRLLKEIGVEVVTATDGQMGLEAFRERRPDLVILEAMLPKIHGFDLCSRITSDAARKAPVIVVSGVYRDAVYKTEALRTFGALAYFEKPLDGALLIKTIRQSLGLHEPVAPPPPLPAVKAPAAEKHAPARKKELAAEDIDSFLKDTLAEFGLRPDKKPAPFHPPDAPRPPVPAPAPPAVAAAPAPAPKPAPARPAEAPKPAPKTSPAPAPMPEKPRPAAAPAFVPKPEPLPSPKPALAPAPVPVPPPASTAAERPAAGREAAPPFSEFSEQPRKKTALYAAVAASLIVVAGLGFMLLRGKKGGSDSGASTPEATAMNTPVDRPAEGQVALGGAAATDPLTPPAVMAENAPVKAKPSPRTAAERPQPAPESLRPVATNTAPKLDLRVSGEPAAKAPAVTTEPAPQPAAARDPEAPKPEPAQPAAKGGVEPAAAEPAPQLPPAKFEPEPESRVQPGQLVPIESVDVMPQVVKEVRPAYPPMAMAMGIEGSVTINALVSETGDVLQTAYLRGIKDGGLDKAAENAVRKMKFTPARKSGINVRVWKPVTVTFRKG